MRPIIGCNHLKSNPVLKPHAETNAETNARPDALRPGQNQAP